MVDIDDFVDSDDPVLRSPNPKIREHRVFQYDCRLMLDYLADYPEPDLETMKTWRPDPETAPAEYWEAILKCGTQYLLKLCAAHDRPIIENLPRVSLRELFVKHINDAIELDESVVVAISANRPEANKVHIVCSNCGESKQYEVEPGMMGKPKWKCGCDDPLHVERIEPSDMIDSQWLRLQEVTRDSKTARAPLTIMARVQGEPNMWQVKFNEHIRPIGILRSQVVMDKNKHKYFSFWFEIITIRRIGKTERDVELTDEIRQRIRHEMEQPQFPDKLANSIAPQISGMETIKKCAALTIASIGLIHPIRTLVIGDPGTGKSEIMEHSSLLLPQTWYVDMAQAARTGLTATNQKDEETGAWMVAPGIFALADGSAVWIDDLQESKDPKMITSLLGVIQRGKVRYTGAGGNIGEFDANCALMICTNPKDGIMGIDDNIHELLGFIKEGRAPFISRMGIILQVRDNKTDKEQREVARAIYRHSQVDILEKYKDDYTKKITTETGETIDVEYFGTTSLRQIFKYIIEEVPVEPMPEEFEEEFIDYYIRSRHDVKLANRVIMTPRFIAHAVSVAQIFARMHGKSRPDRSHVMEVFQMMQEFHTEAAFDPKLQMIDVGLTNGGLPQRTMREQQIEAMSKKSRKEQFEFACKEAMRMTEDADKYFTIELLKQVLREVSASNWSSDEKCKEWIDAAKNEGRMMENKHSRLIWWADDSSSKAEEESPQQ